MFIIGRLQIIEERREILRDGMPVKVGSRAFDLLWLLIQERGRVVSQKEILERVWPGVVVEENNIQVQIAFLRKLLGPDRSAIRTVPGRGYLLVGANGEETQALSHSYRIPDNGAASAGTSATLFGHGADSAIIEMLRVSPIVTLVGPPGAGKSCIARRVFQHVRSKFADGAVAITLSTATAGSVIPALVADTLGLAREFTQALMVDDVVASLAGRQVLLFLDDCEHVVDAAAEFAELLVESNTSIRILCTSREGLRAKSEAIFKVSGLELPDETALGESLANAEAVRLFIARARTVDPMFPDDAASLPRIATICRRLDGNPLAIELAASRAATLGMQVVEDQMHDRFAVLTGGSRNAPERHRSLKGAYDWSYRLLNEHEQVLFRNTSTLDAPFSFDDILRLGAALRLSETATIESLCGLIAKSLVTRQADGEHFGMLESARAYALYQHTANEEASAAQSLMVALAPPVSLSTQEETSPLLAD
ncbi:ATP-binding protein [Paraburkholderia caballeronis]|uniref:Predicted ATPase n=1 Tax=Paraburkholderia caballeronis TaxID=416943 RepID=A0A1H7L8M9_9BURK|nr:winged helix-turn-helix domain-containing protein [Paraburkholderia caballeronis]PXW28316.1 putative ATPase [Paraburkholderia caballeronis]PXX03682.1 putative ATPase [Paraburkholderia caballeronis]RAK04426.1 putative ATPase [Paraburkholderia caballeronis]SED80670.1 Predicted ATPase [Paraburkholderia caballeronis]SEK94617.1 Predicted ATPase [Paraburkholderia caballeronis]